MNKDEIQKRAREIVKGRNKIYKNVLGDNMSRLPKTVNNSGGGVNPISAGFEQVITTITDIVAGVISQKFYRLLGLTPSDFVPIDVSGFGAYSSTIFQYKAVYVGSSFQSGLVAPSTGVGKNATADIVIDGISIKNNFWRMSYEISNEQLQMAERNREAFSIIEEKEKARKTVWDLGIQEVLFKGLGDGVTFGLLNQPLATVDTSLFPKALTKMNSAEVKKWATEVLPTFLANSDGTELFDTWVMPTNVYLGLGATVVDSFPVQTYRMAIEDALASVGREVKLLHSIYNQDAGANGFGRHAFYRYDTDSIRMYIPKTYTPHPLYPVNGLDSVSMAEGQFTGVQLLRDREFMYADEQVAFAS